MVTSKQFMGVIGVIVLLLAATDVMAQSSCTSKTTSEGTGNFSVNVTQAVGGGNRTYTYAITKLTNTNPNKLFVYIHSTLLQEAVTNNGGTILNPHQSVGGFPGSTGVWQVVHHEGGAGWTNIAAVNAPFSITVPEVVQPAIATTTLLIGTSNTFEHCGPIFGPVAPAVAIPGSPLVTTIASLTFADGCKYVATVDLRDGSITALTADPSTPFETNPPPNTAPQPCTVDPNATCQSAVGVPFCGVSNIANPPIQSSTGGTCFYPANFKFTC